MNAAAVIVAAGSGARMGRPKQFLPLLGRAVVEWSLKAFLDSTDIHEIALVLNADDIQRHKVRYSSPRVKLVEGGSTRLGSVRNGLNALARRADVIAVHDGARPLVTAELLASVLKEAHRSGAAVPAVPVKDTLKEVEGKNMQVSSTPLRSRYWLAQTPQCYRRQILEEALKKFPEEDAATDESQLVERAGHTVKVVPSTYENVKITTPEDLKIAETFLLKRFPSLRPEMRTGFGFDVHKLITGRTLWLAGIKIPHGKGLLGHSDGDVALHAACDAVLGAAGLGEIGQLFPSENSKIRGIPSKKIVEKVLNLLQEREASIVHLDVTIVAEEPRLSPHYGAMRNSLTAIWSLGPDRISLKSKSHDGIGEIGKGQAIACYAVATVAVPSKVLIENTSSSPRNARLVIPAKAGIHHKK